MRGKALRSRRIRRPNSVSGIESIQLTWESGEVESYRLVRGSVVWPHESLPGIVLLGGQKLDSDQLTILEERLFQNISESIQILDELWNYSPSRYYSDENPESEGFIDFLRKVKRLQGKIPLVPAVHSDAVVFGNQLIGNFLESGRLVIPSGGTLMTQIQEGRQDTSVEELFGITALRYLLAGINERSWEEEIIEVNFDQCLV